MILRIITDEEDFKIKNIDSFVLHRESEEDENGEMTSPSVKATVERIDEASDVVLDSFRLVIPSNRPVTIAGEDVVDA